MSILSVLADAWGYITGQKVDTAAAAVGLEKFWQAVQGIAIEAESVTSAAGLSEVSLALKAAILIMTPIIELIEAGGIVTEAQIIAANNTVQALFMIAVPHVKVTPSVA